MRVLTLTLALLLAPAATGQTPSPKESAAAKAALQKLGDLVGEWAGAGTAKAGGRPELWNETLSIGWKFAGDSAWLELSVKDGKFLKSGGVRYDAKRKVYAITLTSLDGTTTDFDGKLAGGKLVATGKGSKTGDVFRLSAYTVADGARILLKMERQAKGRGLFDELYSVAGTRPGESFAGKAQKPECLITGGLGTIAVAYNGKTYYVCCSGCRDEFEADPKKAVEAFEKKR